MFVTVEPLILASASPKRRELLTGLGLQFSCVAPKIDESLRPGEAPVDYARRMAKEKAWAVSSRKSPQIAVLGLETVVNIGGRILGKPRNQHEARFYLGQLNGRSHTTITGYALKSGTIDFVGHVVTSVTFGRFPNYVLDVYTATTEPLRKAGGYAIQGFGSFLVTSVEGSITNLAGLPVAEVVQLLLEHRIIDPKFEPKD